MPRVTLSFIRTEVCERYGKLPEAEQRAHVASIFAERRRRILRLREAGWWNRDIGRELGLTARQIRYAVRRGHVTPAR
jgi:DNA-binding NarL/FixJ family response regulator